MPSTELTIIEELFVPAYNFQTMAKVTGPKLLRNSNNLTAVEAHFSVGCCPQARIFGQGRTQDCNSWEGKISIILICS
jgi:hypothetical protein